jgi:hypothetical protein
MDLITFRCAACKQVLKIGADKAGRKAKCKCGADLTIPSASEEAVKPSAPPPKPPAVALDDEEDAGSYGLAAVPEPAQEKPKEEEKKPKSRTTEQKEEEAEERRRRRAALRKAPMDPVQWEKIRVGILLIIISTYLWMGAFVLHKVILILGIFNGPEYAVLADSPILIPPQPTQRPGEELELDKTSFVVGLLAGSDSLDAGLWIERLAQLLVVLQGLVAIAGYAVCLAIPPRFGAHAMAIAALSLAGVNFLLQLVFKLLSLTGAMDYIMIPLVTPEIAMTVANIERTLPLHVYWSGAPFWEMFAALLIQILYFAEPVIFCLFLRAAALAMRDEPLQVRANALIVLVLGTAFGLLAYYLLSVTGTSEVLAWVLRVVYTLWCGFFLGQLIWYAVVMQGSRALIAAKLSEEEE